MVEDGAITDSGSSSHRVQAEVLQTHTVDFDAGRDQQCPTSGFTSTGLWSLGFPTISHLTTLDRRCNRWHADPYRHDSWSRPGLGIT